MDFQTKRFWVAQAIVAVITVAMFMGQVDFDIWLKSVMGVEGGWGILETVGKFAVGGNKNV